jgi:hypothetical protein
MIMEDYFFELQMRIATYKISFDFFLLIYLKSIYGGLLPKMWATNACPLSHKDLAKNIDPCGVKSELLILALQ